MNKGYQHIVLDDFVDRLRTMHAERARVLAQLSTREDALAYQARVRSAVARSFGQPPEKCPLDAKITGTIQKDGYTIENVYFYSRPDYMVTANLYLPDGLSAKAPAVLCTCGHADEGKACSTYQEFAIRLAKNGFVALLYDPAQQGERDQYPGVGYRGMAQHLCGAHNVMDLQLKLLGQDFCSWRVWDGRRALDYLLSRPEVDRSRVGITGNSGGGTLTEWIWANDSRLAFAAPSCHVTTFLTNLENELPTDAEQCPPYVLAEGLEMVDLMLCQAPKPVILLGQKYDFFERRGLLEAYHDLKHFYSLLGAEGKVENFIGPCSHGYSVHNQESMVRFFCQHAGLGDARQIIPQLCTEQELWATPEGSVLKARTKAIYQLAAEMADDLERSRVAPAAGEWPQVLSDLLALPPRPLAPPHYRCLRPRRIGEKMWARYAIETENRLRVIMLKCGIDEGRMQTLDLEEDINVYLPNFGSEEDALSNAVMNGFIHDGILYSLDLRGLGESMPDEEGDFHQPYGMDYMMNSFSTMFGESYLGRRVYDALRSLDLLFAEGAKNIHLVGRGQGAIIATFTAMLCPAIASVVLYDAPATYKEWITSKVCDWPAANVPRGVLRHFDLPDLYTALGRRLFFVNRWNSVMK